MKRIMWKIVETIIIITIFVLRDLVKIPSFVFVIMILITLGVDFFITSKINVK